MVYGLGLGEASGYSREPSTLYPKPPSPSTPSHRDARLHFLVSGRLGVADVHASLFHDAGDGIEIRPTILCCRIVGALRRLRRLPSTLGRLPRLPEVLVRHCLELN